MAVLATDTHSLDRVEADCVLVVHTSFTNISLQSTKLKVKYTQSIVAVAVGVSGLVCVRVMSMCGRL